MGLEPIRSPTRPSSVRVCQFRHWCSAYKLYTILKGCKTFIIRILMKDKKIMDGYTFKLH
jgi:hypothetical protein